LRSIDQLVISAVLLLIQRVNLGACLVEFVSQRSLATVAATVGPSGQRGRRALRSVRLVVEVVVPEARALSLILVDHIYDLDSNSESS
jgi:hypothetical protein